MSYRIEKRFEQLREQKRSALITFIMGGDPDAKTASDVLAALPKSGADLIEIGIPFSDPMADGPTIAAAGKRALAGGMTLAVILGMVKTFRTGDNDTPVILMGYYNPIYRYGVSKLCKDAADAGADGLIIVDLPPEEEQEIRPYMAENDLKLIRLIAPTSNEERTKTLTESASGFVYYISITGITGAGSADVGALTQRVGYLRQVTPLPIAVGFGIKTAAQVKEIAAVADAVVVGSALVEVIAKGGKHAARDASAFVSDLAKGLKR